MKMIKEMRDYAVEHDLKLEIRRHQDEDAHSMTDDVERAVESFVGEAEQSDDLTMLCIKMH